MEETDDLFLSYTVDDTSTLNNMSKIYSDFNYLIDPHTAIASHSVESLKEELDGETLILSTAHPAKFPKSIEEAGLKLNHIPKQLSQALNKEERYVTLPASKDDIFKYIIDNN